MTITGNMLVDKEFTINVDGLFTIEMDLNVAKDLILNVGATGTMDVLGDVDLAKDASLDIDGALDVTGSLTTAKDAVVNVGSGGTLDVGEDLDLGAGSVITGAGGVTAGDCTGAACDDEQLPVTLSVFEAQISNDLVGLSWTTESEENFDYFDIERSIDGSTYSSIGNVKGNGNSKVSIDYTFKDSNPLFGDAYYRITAIDIDGSFEIFNAIIVNYVPNELMVNIFPNPSNGAAINVNFGLPTGARTKSLAIYDLTGNVIKHSYLLENNELIPTDLANGIYLVKIQIDNYIVTKRLIIN